MPTDARNQKRGEVPREATACLKELIAPVEGVPTDGWVADEQLHDITVTRNPLQERESWKYLASSALASGRRTVRLLWIALVVSLAAHLIIPLCIVTAMMRPEKVALMDGTESLIISPLVPLKETNKSWKHFLFGLLRPFWTEGHRGLMPLKRCNGSFYRRLPRRLKRSLVRRQRNSQRRIFIKNSRLSGSICSC